MIAPPCYLIQTRQPGQPWQTPCTTHDREQAEALADVLAAQRSPAPYHLYPLFAHVRVRYGNTTAYDARSTSIS
jgi:hypothetical protein